MGIRILHVMSLFILALGFANAFYFSHQVETRNYWRKIFLNLIWSQGLSWIFGLVTCFLLFSLYWRGVHFCGCTFIHGQSGSFEKHSCFPHGAEYPTGNEMGAGMFWN